MDIFGFTTFSIIDVVHCLHLWMFSSWNWTIDWRTKRAHMLNDGWANTTKTSSMAMTVESDGNDKAKKKTGVVLLVKKNRWISWKTRIGKDTFFIRFRGRHIPKREKNLCSFIPWFAYIWILSGHWFSEKPASFQICILFSYKSKCKSKISPIRRPE